MHWVTSVVVNLESIIMAMLLLLMAVSLSGVMYFFFFFFFKLQESYALVYYKIGNGLC